MIGQGDGKVRVGFLAAQWDAAKYLYNAGGGGDAKKKGGASFPVAVYLPCSSKAGAPERAVAQHLKTAHTKPQDTKPVNSAKNVPGFGTDRKLHRLYRDQTRRDKNRDEAIKVCRKYWGDGYSEGGKKECDEYPFAITHEGCAQALPQYEPSTPKQFLCHASAESGQRQRRNDPGRVPDEEPHRRRPDRHGRDRRLHGQNHLPL
ncbi:hypothetical protein [Streptomyces asiaticus]